MKDLDDEEIPVRAHGLFALRKLINERPQDPVVLENLDFIFNRFLKELSDEDR